LAGRRLDDLIAKRLEKIPALAELEAGHVYDWLTNLAMLKGPVCVVAEDAGAQLVGIFVATPAHLLGATVPVMADLMIVATKPHALPGMVDAVATEARKCGCKSMLLTCEAKSTAAAARWGGRYGARVVAMSLFKEV